MRATASKRSSIPSGKRLRPLPQHALGNLTLETTRHTRAAAQACPFALLRSTHLGGDVHGICPALVCPSLCVPSLLPSRTPSSLR